MGLNLDEKVVTGQTTTERADMTGPAPWGWTVSYLPGRDLSRMQAIAAMHLAELVAQGKIESNWQTIERMADLVGIVATDAIEMVRARMK